MLEYGAGNNDILTSGVITSGTTPVVSKPMSLKMSKCFAAILATTDANGVWGGATGSGIVGAWKIEVSNNYPGPTDRIDGQTEDATNPIGNWVDVTSNFIREAVGAKWNFPATTVITPVTGIPNPSGTGGSLYPVQGRALGFRAIRFTFTPASGQGAKQAAAVFFVSKD